MLKKAFISFIFMFLLVFLQGATPLHAQQDRQYTIKATWLYQFTKYIDWPEPYKDEEVFTIGVFDNDTKILNQLNELVKLQKKAKDRIIKLRVFSSKITITANELDYCDMFYVSKESEALEQSILNIADLTNTLVVGESATFAKQGGSISFYIRDNKIGISINRDIIEAATYKVDPQLLRVAQIVETEK